MDQRTEVLLTRILYTAIAAVGLVIILNNLANPWPVMLLIGLFSLSFTLRNAVLSEYPKRALPLVISFLFDLIIVTAIYYMDSGSISPMLYFIIAADAALILSVRFSTLVVLFIFGMQSFLTLLKAHQAAFASLIPDMTLNLAVLTVVFFAIHAVRYQISQRQKLSETMKELKIKSRQLENTYLKLKETTEDLEDMTILKERNRIAREIHDTVGHTLTTVLLEMEAGERLILKEPDKAAQKIKLAKEQVRKGLQNIRESVHTLKTGREILGFTQSVQLLLEETTRNGSVFVHSHIGELPPLTEAQEKMIYRALQEGLTNGIRHGGSTAFVLNIKYENGSVKLMLSDNGKGTDKLEQGFGLTAMEERVRALGGTLSFNSRTGEGFTIGIIIPVEKEQVKNEQD